MSNATVKNVLIVAGEASGDIHGANLVRAMKKRSPRIRIRGIGGERMAEAGVELIVSSSEIAVVGLTEVFSRLHSILKARRRIIDHLKGNIPDLLILIDYPDFNINLARTAKRFGIPVLYYISPQVWAWRRGRIKKITTRVDHMAVILPFERDIYLKSGTEMPVEYVGHPILDNVPHHLDRGAIKRQLGLNANYPILGLLPGSRNEEIKRLLPLMIGAAEILSKKYPNLKCVLPVAPTITPDLVQSFIRRSSLDVIVSTRDIYSVLSNCHFAFVTSGTATLETAIMEIPMVIIYKVSRFSSWIGKRFIKVPYVGLVNLIAGNEAVPELIQDDITPQGLADEAIRILEDDSKRRDTVKKLRMIKGRLGSGGASDNTAKIALEMLADKR